MEGTLIRRLPGKMCLFLDDGSFLSAQLDKVILYDKLRNEVWSKTVGPHHQMNFSRDGQNFLIVGSGIKEVSNKTGKADKIRYDILYVLDKKGNTLKTFDFYERRNQFDADRLSQAEKRRLNPPGPKAIYKDSTWELTHANSFYEIPENKLSKKYSAFTAGNYIVNDISLMLVFVLSKDLKEVLWQSPILNDTWTMLHDVQVMKDSTELLIYDNGTKDRPQSRMIKFDVDLNKISWQYPSQLSNRFFSNRMGGVQALENGNILFSDFSHFPLAKEVSLKGKEVWSMIPQKELQDASKMRPFQQVKRMDLSKFLKEHRGL